MGQYSIITFLHNHFRVQTPAHVTPGLPRPSASSCPTPRSWMLAVTACLTANSQSTPPRPAGQNSGEVPRIDPTDAPSRQCDSRNLNLSPFCTLKVAGKLSKWAPAVTSTYGNTSTHYIRGLSEPWRLEYPTEKMKADEILTHLSKVNNHSF